jgi:hypothetical protein
MVAHPRDLQRPDVVVDPHVGAEEDARQRRVGQPAGLGELADEQRGHHEAGAEGGHPEAEVVQEREGHVARADLQRHHEVHQARDQRHRHEEDHDHAVGREDLVVVVRRQEAGVVTEGHRLLGAHHQRVGEAAQQHHQAQHDVHDADLLVVDAGDPVVPQRAPQLEVGDRAEQRDTAEHDGGEGHQQDRFVVGDRLPREAAEDELRQVEVLEHRHSSVVHIAVTYLPYARLGELMSSGCQGCAVATL